MYGELRNDVKPLSASEERWLARLEKTLKACPTKRIGLVTIGDSDLTVIDDKIMRKFDLDIHDGKAHENGLVLGYVYGGPSIHGVSG